MNMKLFDLLLHDKDNNQLQQHHVKEVNVIYLLPIMRDIIV